MAKQNSRDWGKQAFWRGKIQSQGRSGLSIRAFCRRERISEPGFYHWRRELVRRQAATKPKAAFVPVRVTPDPNSQQVTELPISSGIEILLAQGYRVRLSGPVDAAALGQVLAVLEGRP